MDAHGTLCLSMTGGGEIVIAFSLLVLARWLPLPLGEGWGEGYGCYQDALILTFSQREKGRTRLGNVSFGGGAAESPFDMLHPVPQHDVSFLALCVHLRL